jgi:predicted adenine nucleotide alpha hydrolase (AANH) superfamily ATPase
MHICCANCCIYPLQTFLSQGVDIKGLWFNPNIHPYTEYLQRLDSLQKLQSIWHCNIEYIDIYPLDTFLRSTAGLEERRCAVCYSLRLDKTAEIAKKMNVDGFTTSLLASPYQQFDMIIGIGREAGKKHGVEFHVQDFRQGWMISKTISREFGLYRQKYCGCIYSEMEKYLKKKKTKLTAQKPKK